MMGRLRILFIDDNETSVGPAMKWVGETHHCDFVSFKNFEDEIASRQPHITVIDRMEGTPPQATDEGIRVFDVIWTRRFCPVVIYSAFPDDGTLDDREAHPFVKHVKKAGDLREFQNAVSSLLPHAQALEEAEQHIRQQLAIAMREVAPYAAETFSDPTQYKDAVTRQGRRRLAALMDETSLGTLASWEQYIHPPVCEDLLLGDVLLAKSGSKHDPKSFRIVLTPSCDLATAGGRKAKVEQVLVASCCAPKEAIQGTALCKMKKKELCAALTGSVLTQGYYQKIVPFPSLKDKIPPMMADLKNLHHISLSDIVPTATAKYERIASLDSPFRELISWAYMHTACRPGLPDRDFDSWNKEIMDAYGS